VPSHGCAGPGHLGIWARERRGIEEDENEEPFEEECRPQEVSFCAVLSLMSGSSSGLNREGTQAAAQAGDYHKYVGEDGSSTGTQTDDYHKYVGEDSSSTGTRAVSSPVEGCGQLQQSGVAYPLSVDSEVGSWPQESLRNSLGA